VNQVRVDFTTTSRLTDKLPPYVNGIIGDRQCGFCRNRSTNDQIFSTFGRY
jgi:hypothetical protein